MSGSISFGKEQHWFAAGWAWCNFLESLCALCGSSSYYRPLAAQLCREESSAQIFEYIDLTLWDSDQRRLLLEAVQEVMTAAKSTGPVNWTEPNLFASYIVLLDSLIVLLEEANV